MMMEKNTISKKIESFLSAGFTQKDLNRLNGIIRRRLKLLKVNENPPVTSVYLYEAEDFELNPYDGVHGGFICSLFDVAMALTCCALTDSMVTTCDLQLRYLRPLPKGDYHLITEITHIGQTLISAVSKICPADDNLLICATCSASFMRVKEGYKIVQDPRDLTAHFE